MTFEAAAGNQQSLRAGVTYDGKIAGLYDLGETLGSGHFAVVKQARHVFTGAKVAVKVVDKTKLDEVSKAHLFQEVRCMKLVQHPNVVRLYEVIDTQTKLYLVLELGDGGDLYDYIMKHEGGLNQNLARKYFRQILRAITYCHKLHVVHRDLKPENVVFFEKLGLVKLTDFGFSNKFSPGQKLETFCGSLAYSAPEILLGDSYDAPAVDIWSLGVILYMLVCGQPPFEKANDSETLTMIMDCKYTVPAHIGNGCQQLIASMLVRDPKKRASLEEIALDLWLSENNEQHELIDCVPLVSRQEICEEDHNFIVQKMVNGNISTKEEIQRSLDMNKYDHITATYFLLAEMKLRKRQEEQNAAEFGGKIDSNNTKRVADNRMRQVDGNMVPVNLNVCTPIINEPKMAIRSRKCSIVREEDEDESAAENVHNTNELTVAVTRRESISDGRLNQTVHENVNVVVPRVSRKKISTDLKNDLAAEIFVVDGNELKKNAERSVPMQEAIKGLKDMEIGKFKNTLLGNNNNKSTVLSHRRTKLSKVRTPSCSSSEASDDDTKVRNRKKLNKFVGDTPTRFRMHRRDSYDDSSDSQDQTFPPADSQPSSIINNSSATDKTKCQQNQSKEQKKDDNQKSSNTNTRKNKRQSKEYADSHYRTKSYTTSSMRRHSQGELLSLDRINEAQECETRYSAPETAANNFFLRTCSLTKAKTQHSADNINMHLNTMHMKETLSLAVAKDNTLSKFKHQSRRVYDLKLIRELDIVLDESNEAKTTIEETTSSSSSLSYMTNFVSVVNCS